MNHPINPPFVVFTMPYTLDNWLAKWLRCGHNGMLTFSSLNEWIEDVKNRGSVESFIPVSWKVLKQTIPNLRLAIVNRPISEIIRDLNKLKKPVDEELLWQHFYVLEAITKSANVGVLELSSNRDITDALHEFWKFLHPREEFDEEWFDICCEEETLPRIEPIVIRPRLFQEAIAESARLGGNARTLWLN